MKDGKPQTDFERAFDFVLGVENYYSNLKGDKGKRTVWGIAERWHPKEVAAMLTATPDEAKAIAKVIYLQEYWKLAGCDKLAWPLNLAVFDAAVQHAPADARRFLKQSRGDLGKFMDVRRAYYEQIAKEDPEHSFPRGWMNRLNKLQAFTTKEAE